MSSFFSLCGINIQVVQLTLPNDYRNYEDEAKVSFPAYTLYPGKNANDNLKHLDLNWTYVSFYSLGYFK